jgi:N-sulfoglucosamine sulfohydrolase
MRSFLIASALLAALPTADAVAGAKSRPNILILIADDWAWPHAGAYGDKVARTPNIDRLAKKGMIFHRAFTAAPSCTPSRAGILTGQAIHRLQDGGNLHGVLPPEYVCFPDLLRRAGYTIGLVGKGWGPGSLEGTGRQHNPAGPPAKNFRDFLKAVPRDGPFYFWFGSNNPHRPYKLGSGAAAGYKLDMVKVPPIWPDTPEVRSDILDYYAEVEAFDRQVGDMLQALEDSGRAGDTIVFILSDNGMPFPRAKANLYDIGAHLPLIVRPAGNYAGGKESRAFISYTDLAPTILEAAGLKPLAAMTGKSFYKILTGEDDGADRTRAFIERERHANVRKGDLSYPARALRTEQHLYIRNFRPDRWPAGDPQRHFAVGPFGDIDDGPTKQLLMKMDGAAPELRRLHELSMGKRPAEELYDCTRDPHQMHNVADDPAYAKAKEKLRFDLEAWMRQTDDPRAARDGGDDRWDTFKYFGAPAGGKKGKKAASK